MADEADEGQAWKEAGQLLRDGREQTGLSKREAARMAGFSEITWRQLEAGERQIAKGVKVPPSPKDETLVAAAEAARVSVERIFEIVGRELPPPLLRARVKARIFHLQVDDVGIELDPTSDEAIQLSAQGVDLAELKELDPDAYQQVVELARFHLERARERRR